jgi:hypothetical protein
MESDLMTDHNMFGWYLYIPFMFLLFMWGNKLADNDQLSTPTNTNNNKLATFKARPALTNTLLFLVLVTITSSGLKTLLIEGATSNTNTNTTKIPEISPIVNNFDRVEKIELQTGKSQTLYLKYFFNGTLSGGKPNDFSNSYIPLGWHEAARETIENWQYITVVKQNKTALVRFSFSINDKKTASAGAFKKQRIIAALTGKSESYLHWQFITCSTTCKQEITILKELN